MSWQPSQDANFQTASFGRAAHSSRTASQGAATRRTGRPGPSRQMSVGPSWQWPQWPTPQLHVALERDVDALGRKPRARSASTAKRIITSGPHTNAVADVDRTGAVGTSFGTTPTFPRQSLPARVHCHVDRGATPRAALR